MSLEPRLRSALRRVEPDTDLAAAVLARLDAPAAIATRVAPRGGVGRWAIAASLLLAIGAGFGVQQYRLQAREEAAGRQLAHALELTSRELENVHRRLESKTLERGS